MARLEGIYCDTNVFIYAIEGADNSPLRRAITSLFLLEHDRKRPILKTSLLTVSELMVHPYKSRDAQLESAYRIFWQSSDFLEVGPIDLDIMLNAAQLRASYPSLKLPDAIHLATAFAFGCPVFLTADEGIKDEYNLEFRDVHPLYPGTTTGRATIRVQRPSVGAIAGLIEEIAK